MTRIVKSRRKTSLPPKRKPLWYTPSYAIVIKKRAYRANGGPASGYRLWLPPLAKRLLRNHFGLFHQGPERLLRSRGVDSMLTPDQIEAAKYRDGIREFLTKTPKDVARWSYQRAVGFKEACKRAEKVAGQKTSTKEKLYQAWRDLGGYC